MRTIHPLIVVCFTIIPTYAKYSGGSGEPGDPYLIATAEDLMLLGETPEDYNKHFLLTVDIDMDPNLPGRKVFDRAVIAPDISDALDSWGNNWFNGTPFGGVFDGDNHIISHLTVTGVSYLGLFGQLDSGANIFNLGLEAVSVSEARNFVGALVGHNRGSIASCYCNGLVEGNTITGSLVGENEGNITSSYSTGLVKGFNDTGGLVGTNGGNITLSCSASLATGNYYVGGLVGENEGSITLSYSHGLVTGYSNAGGLVGNNKGTITLSYSTGLVTGNSIAGGLVGKSDGGNITSSFWDTEAAGLSGSDGGTGLTTSQMQDINTFLDAGWDFVGERSNGTGDFWQIEAFAYPALAIFSGTAPPAPQGSGLSEDPYLVSNVSELYSIWYRPTAHYRLETNIDLSGITWNMAMIPWLNGRFDGNDHVISHLSIQGKNYLGLFGHLGSSAKVTNLGLEAVSVSGTSNYVGGLVGENEGSITSSYSTGSVDGGNRVGGLVGVNMGGIIDCYTTGNVNGHDDVGGLAGSNSGSIEECFGTAVVWSSGWDPWNTGGLVGYNQGSISTSFSQGEVHGRNDVGGLVGWNGAIVGSPGGSITNCYATKGKVYGVYQVGGLVGGNHDLGSISRCYSTGQVNGGGLVGQNWGSIGSSFWDIETSGHSKSAGGEGLPTVKMQDVQTYLDAGWDFVGESANGVSEIWRMPEQGGYPILAAFSEEYYPPQLPGQGTAEDPYLISTAAELTFVSHNPTANYRIVAPLDLSDMKWSAALIPIFKGIFDGNDLAISNLHIEGGGYLGLFGELGSGAVVTNLHLENAIINGNGLYIGALTGYNNGGHIQSCTSTVTVSGYESVGGLVGYNLAGTIIDSGSLVSVDGGYIVGGLVGGNNSGSILNCYSTGTIRGEKGVGGLVATNIGDLPGGHAEIRNCYSTCDVYASHQFVGGLVGHNGYSGDCSIINCYSAGFVSSSFSGNEKFLGGLVGGNWDVWNTVASFWDTETSGQSTSAGGTGLPTVYMQDINTYLEAGWDFVDENINGTEDIWYTTNHNYPQLWWERDS